MLALVSTSVFWFSTICPAADSVTCPETINTRQELKTAIAGWTPRVDDAPHSLAGITFYDGPPAEKASLVYDRMTRGKAEQTATWLFTSAKDRPIWVACSYAGTAIELSKNLPSATTTCSVTYNPQQQIAGLPMIKKIACR